MRLIDADALHDFVSEEFKDDVPYEWAWALTVVDCAPAVDAVPVVRCRECTHHYWVQEPCHGKSVHYCKLPHMRGIEIFKEFFCYYGERKEGADNG